MTCDLNQRVRTKADTQSIVEALVSTLKEKFPNIKTELLSTEEIQEIYGDSFVDKKGFAFQSQVVLNKDLMTIDTPLHEFGHFYLKVLAETNPDKYTEIIEVSSRFPDHLEALSSIYPELNETDLKEEFFVSNLGLSQDQLLGKFGTGGVKSTLRNLLNRFKSWIVGATSKYGFKSNPLSNVNSLLDILSQVTNEMLDPSIKQFIRPDFLEDIRYSKASTISDEKDLVKALVKVDLKNIDLESDEYINLYIQNVINYAKAGFSLTDSKGGIVLQAKLGTYFSSNSSASSTEQKVRNFTDKFLSGVDPNFNTFITLDKLHTVEGFKDLGRDKYKKYKHILVKVNSQKHVTFYDMSNKSLSGSHNNKDNRKYIGSAFLSDRESEKLGITYTKNKVDVAKLQLGILALRVQKEVPASKIDRIFVNEKATSEAGTPVIGVGTYIDEVVHNLNALTKIPELGGLFEGDIKELLSTPLSPEAIRTNIEEYYTFWINANLNYKDFYKHLKTAEKSKVVKNVKDIAVLIKSKDNPIERQKLITALSERYTFVSKSETLYYKEEKRILERYIAELTNIDDLYRQDQRFTVGLVQAFVDSIASTGNPILDKLFEYLTMAAGKIRRYMISFSKKDDIILEKLIEEFNKISPITSRIENFTTNDARKFFASMIEYQMAYDPATKSKVKVKTGRFVQPDSDEYKGLSAVQKEYIAHFNSSSAEAIHKLHESSEVQVKNFIPIMKSAPTNFYKDTLTTTFTDPGKLPSQLRESWSKFWASGIENYSYHLDEQESSLKAFDSFIGQHTMTKEDLKDSPYGNERRLALLGLSYVKGELVLNNPDLNSGFETDLSYVLNSFVASNIRKYEFDQVQPVIDSLKSFLVTNKELFGNAADKSVKMLEDFFTRFVNEELADPKELASFTKVINKLQSQGNIIILGGETTTALKNLSSGWFSNFKEAIFNFFTGEGFGLWAIAEAHAYVIGDAAKDVGKSGILSKISAEYGLFNMDFKNITSNQNLKTSMTPFRSKWLFYLNHAGDTLNRRLYAAATFIQEGSFDAWSTDKDGNLIYDEKKDKRFYESDGTQTTQQKTLLAQVKSDMIAEGGLDEKGNLKYGHTIRMRNNMKKKSDRMHGAYDQDTSNNFQAYSLGKAFNSLFRYFIDKGRQYGVVADWSKDSSKMFSQNEGKYVPVLNEKGEIIGQQWQGESQEAILASFFGLITGIKNNNGNIFKAWKDTSAKGKKNTMYLFTDMLALFLLMKAFQAFIDDKDEDELDEGWTYVQLNLLKGMIDTAGLGIGSTTNNQGEFKFAQTYVNKAREPLFVTTYWADVVEAFGDLFFTHKPLYKEGENILDNRNMQKLVVATPVVGLPYKIIKNVADVSEDFNEE